MNLTHNNFTQCRPIVISGKTKLYEINDLYLGHQHYDDLKKSGLLDKTIGEAEIKSVIAGHVERNLNVKIDGIATAYEIPFDNGFNRFKVFYKTGQEFFNNGDSKPKYLTKKGSVNRLYIPSKVKPILKDLSIPLDITEGEKKALKGSQEGLFCIGVTGLWGWKVKGENKLIPDFGQIDLKGRTVILTPDNDWLEPDRKGEPKNLKQAVHEFAYLLIDKGAKVYWRKLPKGNLKGLDDYLNCHSLNELRKLPLCQIRKHTIQELIDKATHDIKPEELKEIVKRLANIKSMSGRALCINKLSEKTGVSKRDISADTKTINSVGGVDQKERTGEQDKYSANFEGLIDIAINNEGGTVFIIKTDGELIVVPEHQIHDEVYVPPSKSLLPFLLPRANEVIKWYRSDNDTQLFEDLIAYFKRFSYLPDKPWLIVACKVFLSYIQDHNDVNYLPELLFWAVPERGKSKTGKAITYVSFRGIHLVELREANLFRYSQDMKATLFFDMMNLWKKAENNKVEDILLQRYEKGATVSRVLYPEKGAFKDMEHYSIYGPTILATNEAIDKILDTRCIPITMPNKPGRYEDPKPEKAQELKERLTAWRARVLDIPLPVIKPLPWLNGRLWDISKPLLQVCELVYPVVLKDLKSALMETSNQKREDKRGNIEGIVLNKLCEILPKQAQSFYNASIETSKLLDALNQNRPNDKQLTPQYLGKKLKAMGVKTKKIGGYSTIEIDKDFPTLLDQYGFEIVNDKGIIHIV